jgi:hypothetical protein
MLRATILIIVTIILSFLSAWLMPPIYVHAQGPQKTQAKQLPEVLPSDYEAGDRTANRTYGKPWPVIEPVSTGNGAY